MTAIVPGGLGLLRDEQGVVFCRGALPGERVVVEIDRRRGGVRHGRLLQVLEPSPQRVAPDCPLHPRCGGCDLLDLEASARGAVKAAIVQDVLSRIARLDAATLARVEAVREPTPGLDGARRRARLVVDGAGRPAFSERQSHERVAVGACPALLPSLSAALPALAAARLQPGTEVRLAGDDSGRVVAALTAPSAPDLDATARAAARLHDAGIATLVLDGDGREHARVGDVVVWGEVACGVEGGPYASDAAVFTQATRFGARAIWQEALRGVGDVAGRAVLELFCGAGHITLPLLAAGARVTAVEGAARSVGYLDENARRQGSSARLHSRVAFIDGDVVAPDDLAAVVIDPPRSGFPDVARLLARLRPPRVVMVSCDPATGARDLRAALAASYALERLVPLDAFPRTAHVEWVATLRAT